LDVGWLENEGPSQLTTDAMNLGKLANQILAARQDALDR
jgi:hypothetical protein